MRYIAMCHTTSSLQRGKNGHKTVCLLSLSLQCWILFKKHMDAQTGRLVKELKANCAHLLWIKYVCNQKKFKCLFTYSSKPVVQRWKGQESYSSSFSLSLRESATKNASHSTEEKQIRNCGHNLVGRGMSQKGEDMNNFEEGSYWLCFAYALPNRIYCNKIL